MTRVKAMDNFGKRTSTWMVQFQDQKFRGFQSQQLAELFAGWLWQQSQFCHSQSSVGRLWMDDRGILYEVAVVEGNESHCWGITAGNDTIYFDLYELAEWTGGEWVAVQTEIVSAEECETGEDAIVRKETATIWFDTELRQAVEWFVKKGYLVDEIGENGESIQSQAEQVKAKFAEAVKSLSDWD